MNCILYARVSTEEQAELSIPAQVQAMREFARRHNWIVVAEFLEPGVSGRSIERRVALQAMLSRCRENPKVDVVLVHKIDRLARSVLDHATIRFMLQQRSIKLASVVENVDDSVSGQLLENIMASIAQFYSANLGEEVKKGMRILVERGGWPHKPPRGYLVTRDEQGKSGVEINVIEAEALREAFEQYATGLFSLDAIRRRLADHGVLTSAGKPLPTQYVRDMLQNPFYAGRVRWNGAVYEGRHSALIPEQLFARVQVTLRARYRDCGEKGRLHFLMRGVARCGTCAAKMTAERHDRWAYYRCVNHTTNRSLCEAPFSNVAKSDQSLLALYKSLRLPPGLKTRLLKAAEDIVGKRAERAKQQLQSLRMKKAKTEAREVELTEAFAAGEISRQAYKVVAGKCRQQVLALERAIAEATTDPAGGLSKVQAVLDVADSLFDLNARLDETGHVRLLRVVFREIILEQGAIIGYRFNAPFDHLFGESPRPPRTSPGAPSKGAPRWHLEHQQVAPTIQSILEFDSDALSLVIQHGDQHAA